MPRVAQVFQPVPDVPQVENLRYINPSGMSAWRTTADRPREAHGRTVSVDADVRVGWLREPRTLEGCHRGEAIVALEGRPLADRRGVVQK